MYLTSVPSDMSISVCPSSICRVRRPFPSFVRRPFPGQGVFNTQLCFHSAVQEGIWWGTLHMYEYIVLGLIRWRIYLFLQLHDNIMVSYRCDLGTGSDSKDALLCMCGATTL